METASPAQTLVKFAEHLYDHVLERVPHRHIIFTIPKRARAFLRFDRRLNDIRPALQRGCSARYIERCSLSLEKLSIDEDIVTYTTNDGQAHEFDALEFLALLSCQIPRPYESVTRFYGWYSCRARGERKKRRLHAAAPSEVAPAPESALASASALSWAQCMKRLYEINPLQCPRCGAEMRVSAFLHS